MESRTSSDLTLNTQRIGFVSSRISGTDGVSLDMGNWTEIVEEAGYGLNFRKTIGLEKSE